MLEFEASIVIDVPADKIWNILLDVGSYPDFDPYCEKIKGVVKKGAKLTAFSTLSPGVPFPFKVSVLDMHKKMVWTGGLPLGLFKGERIFTLSEITHRQTEFRIKEVFSGLLEGVFGRMIPDMTVPFEKFAAGLKERAEGKLV